MTEPSAGEAATGVPTCYRHPGREAHIRCQRCDRTICPDCMNSAAVGFQCPDCVKEGNKGSRQNRALYGGERSADPRLTTYVLLAVNALVWLAIEATGRGSSRLADLLSLTPDGRCDVADGSGRYYPGVGDEAVCATIGGTRWHEGVADGAWWQMITSNFTHVSLWHIALNLMALFLFGPYLERIMGRVRFLLVYFIGGLASSVVVLWFSNPDGSTLGASGALYAVLGALIVTYRRAQRNTEWLVQNLLLGVLITVVGWQYISWQGHLGGLLGGGVAAAIIAYAPRAHRSLVQWTGLGAFTVLLLALTLVRVAALS